MTDGDQIRLQEWWMKEVMDITGRVIKAEEKRQEQARARAMKTLGEYRTEADIQEAYAYGMITSAKRDRLMNMLEKNCVESSAMYEAKLKLLREEWEVSKQLLEELKAKEAGA